MLFFTTLDYEINTIYNKNVNLYEVVIWVCPADFKNGISKMRPKTYLTVNNDEKKCWYNFFENTHIKK